MLRKTLIFLALFATFPCQAQIAKDLTAIYTDLKEKSKSLTLLKTHRNFIRIKSSAVFQNLSSTKLDVESAEVAIGIFYIDAMRRVLLNEQPNEIPKNMDLIEKALTKQNATNASADNEQWLLLVQLFDLVERNQQYQITEKLYTYIKGTQMVSPFEAIFGRTCLTYRSYGAPKKALDCVNDLVKRGKYLPDTFYSKLQTNLRVAYYFESMNTLEYEKYIKTLTSTTAANRLLNKPFQNSNLYFLKGNSPAAIKELDSIITQNQDPSPEGVSLRSASLTNKARILIKSGNLSEALKIINTLGTSSDNKISDNEYRYLLLTGYYYLKVKDYAKIVDLFEPYVKSGLKLEYAFEEIHLYGIYCGAGFLSKRNPPQCKEIQKKYEGLERISDITPSVLISLEAIKKSILPTQKISVNLIPRVAQRPDLEVYQILGNALK